MSCYIIMSEQQQMYDNTVHADAKNAGGGRGRFSCRINMRSADAGSEFKNPAREISTWLRSNVEPLSPVQRTLDLGRVRTASIHRFPPACVRAIKVRTHTRTLFNQRSDPLDWTLSFSFFFPSLSSHAESQLGVGFCPSVRLLLHPSPASQPLSWLQWEGRGGAATINHS